MASQVEAENFNCLPHWHRSFDHLLQHDKSQFTIADNSIHFTDTSIILGNTSDYN